MAKHNANLDVRGSLRVRKRVEELTVSSMKVRTPSLTVTRGAASSPTPRT